VEKVVYRPTRKRLPKSRPSRTTSFSVGGAGDTLTSGSYPDDGLGELFLKLGKQGSTLSGVMDAFSIAVSIGLQYGVPLETFVQKFTNLKFEPAGLTDDPDIRMAQSIMDYIFRRLALDYLSFEDRAELGIYTATERARQVETGSYLPAEVEKSARQSRSRTTRAMTSRPTNSPNPWVRCGLRPPQYGPRQSCSRRSPAPASTPSLPHLRHQDVPAAAAMSARGCGSGELAADRTGVQEFWPGCGNTSGP
jgi:ribonucleoside-diphosphate reductase alpha chain